MSGLFFPLVLGVWWKRATREGAIAGILAGISSGLVYLLYVYPKFSVAIWGVAHDPWLGIDHLRFGMIGAPICLVTMVVVSLMTKEPDAATQKWLMTVGYLQVKLSWVNNTSNKLLKIKGANFSPLFFI
jgi:cation/acetate symporter